MLLGAVNVLQVIISMPLFNIYFPSNAENFYSLLANIVTFNIVPTATIENAIFNFTSTTSAYQYYNMDIF